MNATTNTPKSISIGKRASDLHEVLLPLKMANRHGLIAGATGTGKTVTLQALAERFSRSGVSVFAADIKGDLSGLAKPAGDNPRIKQRVLDLKLEGFTPAATPVTFWDLYGTAGVPIRTTVSEVGPVLLSRLLELNETQSQVLQMVFKMADDQGLLLLDLKDIQELVRHFSENTSELRGEYGNLSPASLGAIQRALINLSERGGESFFGEPALKLESLLQRDFNGQGVVNILDATKLLEDSTLYSSFLLWLLSELFEELPEVGDLDAPKLVFFFDEAHLLFRDAPANLLSRIEQLVRLIRSKGVGVFFVTQSPADIPDTVLAQLGTRIQHALRAYTPKEQKAIKTAAQSFRANPALDTVSAITELIVGEALVSALDESGKPQMVERLLISPPESQVGVVEISERKAIAERSPLFSLYKETLDRESAFEVLKQKAEEKLPEPEKQKASTRQSPFEAFAKSILRSIGSQLGREIIRGVLGSIKKR